MKIRDLLEEALNFFSIGFTTFVLMSILLSSSPGIFGGLFVGFAIAVARFIRSMLKGSTYQIRASENVDG